MVMSQESFAREIGVNPGTLARWEKDKNQPKDKHLEKLNTLLIRQLLPLDGVFDKSRLILL